MKHFTFLIFAISLTILSSCYSFKNTSIPAGVNTFYVATFENRAPNAVATFSDDFTESLNSKIRNQSRLKYTGTDPDVEFSGAITRYTISAEAPLPGETVSFNRLEVAISVDFKNNQDEKADWTRTFSRFYDFETSVNIIDIQEIALEEISELLTEDIFNASFTTW